MKGTETCACGATITVEAREGLGLAWRLSEWRREHRHDLDAADACRERDEWHAEAGRMAEACDKAEADLTAARERIAELDGLLAMRGPS